MNDEPQLWTPPLEWDKQDAFLIGGGPSLAAFDFSVLRGRNVIGCNDAFNLGAEIVKYCLFGDASWWQRNKWKLEEEYKGILVTNAPTVLSYKVKGMLKMERERDGIHKRSVLGWNYSTGAAAINLAISLGAVRIFLLGYDLGNKGGASHWHKHNEKAIHEYAFKRFLGGFDFVKRSLPKNVQVLNVTDGTSNLHSFEDMSFEHFKSILDVTDATKTAKSAKNSAYPALQVKAGRV